MNLIDFEKTALPPEPEPGIYLNVPDDVYFGWPYLSKSALGMFTISPAHYYAHRTGKLSFGSSPSKTLGSAVDKLWFFGEEAYRASFAEEPPGPHLKKNGQPYDDWLGSKPGKAWAEVQRWSGKTVLSRGLVKKTRAMVARLDSHEGVDGHPSASQIKDAGLCQVSIVFVCPRTGIWIKGRPDIVDFDLLACDDLKSGQDVRPAGFSKAISSYDYHWQAYIYTWGLSLLTDTSLHDWIQRYVTVRNEPVHSVEIYTLRPSALLQAEAEVHHHLREYRRCASANHWPAHSGELREVDLTAWRRKTYPERSYIR